MAGVKNERYNLGLTDYDPDTWPQSVNHYRIDTSFMVTAHNEKQALLRWREFQEVLEYLNGNEWHAHEIVRYVRPHVDFADDDHPTPPERLTFLRTQTEEEMPRGGMASGVLPEEAWLDPYSDDDYDPVLAAKQIFFSEPSDEEENLWPPMEFNEEIDEDGFIHKTAD